MRLWKAFQKKSTKEEKHKSLSTKTSTRFFNENEFQSPQVRRAHTDEDYRSQNRKSQVTEVKPQHKKPYQPNTQDNKPFPKHSSQKPPQLKNIVMEKYKELNREIREIESKLEADKGEILALLYKLNPDNDIDEAGIDKCAGDARKILESLIQKAGEDTEFNLERKRIERARVEKESENSKAHLSDLREAMDSTRNEFQKPENEKTMSDLFSKLNDAFTNTLQNNPKAQKDYNKVYSFIADDDLKCKTCKGVRTSSQFIQKKIKSDGTTWTDNFNKKISVSLTNVKHDYNSSEIYNILKIYKLNSTLIGVIEELHKLYSGYKDKKDINDFKLKPSTRHSLTPQSPAKSPAAAAPTPQLSRSMSKRFGLPRFKGGPATNKTRKQ